MSYGAELWGWKEWRKLEKIQLDYIWSTLGLDFCTSRYIIVRETGRIKMQRDWIRRAIKFEQKCAKAEEGRLIKIVWEQQAKEGLDEERREALDKLGLSYRYIELAIRNGIKIEEEVEGRMVDIIKQETEAAVDKARYNSDYAKRKSSEKPKYLRTYKKGVDIRIMARIRCGNLEERNRFWKKGEGKCVLCGEFDGSLMHLSNECKEVVGNKDGGNIKKWKTEEIVNPEGCREVVKLFKKIDAMIRNSRVKKEEEIVRNKETDEKKA
uniref:Reverse transcriptase zinc-binding domain-containing protein n=1 Tax=Trichogramma kaykai TaxID=54128 RepID=A0ABD2WZL9_9HYME